MSAEQATITERVVRPGVVTALVGRTLAAGVGLTRPGSEMKMDEVLPTSARLLS